MNLARKKINNENGVIGLIAVILLILGIIVGVFLVQTRTNLLPKAFDPGVSAPVTPAPSASPIPQRRVFITSKKYNGNLGGLSGADAKCQSAAADANLGGNWKAWLSSNTLTASARLEHSTGPYKLLNGKVVANAWSDLTDGILQNQIDVTELNQAYPSLTDKIWTGTTYSGGYTPLGTNVRNCLDWTTEATTSSGGTGTINMYSSWTDNGGYNNCATLQPLYCFEQAPTETTTNQKTATLKLGPNKNANVGDTVQMSVIAVSPVDSINLYSAQITFPADKLEVTDITVDTTKFNNTFEKYYSVTPTGTGEISIIMGNSAPVALPQSSSSGMVVGTITFKTKTSGTSDISFNSKSKIYRASDGVDIFNLASAVNGQITANPVVAPTSAPTSAPTPTPPAVSSRRVFVTQNSYSPNFSGVFGADQKCQISAESAQLGGTWKAWISDGSHNVPQRFESFNGPYKLLNGTVIANNWTQLISGSLLSPINVTEFNQRAPIGITPWTGTLTNGQVGDNTCLNWTSSTSSYFGSTGSTNTATSQWNASGSLRCDSGNLPLYCFEQGSTTPPTTPAPPSVTPTPASTPNSTPASTPTTLGPCTITKAEWTVQNSNSQWVAPTVPVNSNTNAGLNVEASGDCNGKQISFNIYEDDSPLPLATDPVKVNPTSVVLSSSTYSSNYVVKSIWLTEFQDDGFFGAGNPPEYKFTASIGGTSTSFTSTNQIQVLTQAGNPIFIEGDLNRSGGKPDLGDLSWLLSHLGDIKDEFVDYNKDGAINNLDRSYLIFVLQSYGELRSTGSP